jgi:hypothetical protein
MYVGHPLTLPSILANAFDKDYTADRAVEDLAKLMNQASLAERWTVPA